ncbi:hypothetical protein DFH09DRAFT_1093968 [Mycena vulgaris]|nr:hypothetical protein DFH09DRAFT_1093968 [Mycena vulgaris]
MSDPTSQKCTSCKCHKPVECFEMVHGKRKRPCRACLGKKQTKKTQDPSEETGPNAPSVDDALEDDAYLSIVTLEDFLAAIVMDENARSLGAVGQNLGRYRTAAEYDGVATYDPKPEVADVVASKEYDFVMCNFAPPDMEQALVNLWSPSTWIY